MGGPFAPVPCSHGCCSNPTLLSRVGEESRGITCSNCQAHVGPLLSIWWGEPLELPEFSLPLHTHFAAEEMEAQRREAFGSCDKHSSLDLEVGVRCGTWNTWVLVLALPVGSWIHDS